MNTFMRFAEVDCDVISGGTVKTIEGYVVTNFEFANSSGFWDIKNDFLTAAAADVDDSIKRKRFRMWNKKA